MADLRDYLEDYNFDSRLSHQRVGGDLSANEVQRAYSSMLATRRDDPDNSVKPLCQQPIDRN